MNINKIKYSISVVAIFLITAGSAVNAQESDYQIQQDFQTEYNELIERVDNAVSSGDLTGLQADIESLEASYSGSSNLINAAIYPQTFEEVMADLRSRFANTEQNISVIEQLNERIEELNSELRDFRTRLSEFEEESESLEKQLEESRASESRVSGLARQYRENLEARDEFVVSFMRELLNRFDEMDEETLSELADSEEMLEENPIDIIKTIVSEYINRADQEANLEPADYLQMRAQHAYFQDVWDSIGQNLSEVFAADRPVQAEQEVADMIAAWEASINNKLWDSLSTAFTQNGIELPSFNSDDSFYDALNNYVDESVEVSRQQNSEEDYETYTSFNNFWNNRIKASWGDHLVEGNVLEFSDIAAIDLKINDWNEAAVPTSNLMLILFIISIVVILGLIVMLVTNKS